MNNTGAPQDHLDMLHFFFMEGLSILRPLSRSGRAARWEEGSMAKPGPVGGRKPVPVGRRRFLALACAMSAALTAPTLALAAAAAEPVSGAGLAPAFKDRASAIAIGLRYLGHFPDDPRHEVLAEGRRLAGASDPTVARSALRARVRQDFERGDTVMLDGWVLSRRECRACAALALTAGAADRAPGL
jgi:hypothetical protein